MMRGVKVDARHSLVGRLVWLAAGWSVLLLIATGIGLSALFRQSALTEFEQGLNEDINSLLAGSTVSADGRLFAPTITDDRATHAYSGKYWQLAEFRPDGKLHVLGDQKSHSLDPPDTASPQVRSRSLFDQAIASPPDAAERLKRAHGRTFFYQTEGPDHQRLLVGVRETRIEGYNRPAIFMVAQDRGHIDDDIRRFSIFTAVALVIVGAGLVAAVFVQVRVGLEPLFGMRREIGAVRQGRIQRVAGRYPSEIQPLADELNALLDHNQEVVERQRTHVGNLAHALKTPISVMLAEARSTPGPLAEVVERQAGLMQGQVEHHLRRARAAARSTTTGERTSVAEVLDELARALGRVFPDGEIEWDAEEELCFQGERQDLQEIAGNLMENACKWRRGRVRALALPAGEHRLKLVVEDDGPGLPEAARVAALARGERLDESAPGSGLGLSIVRELVEAYGGALTLGDSTLGGLKVELTLPRVG